MSTYYSLCCDKCKEEVSFVCRNFPDRWSFMFDETRRAIPEFVRRHEGCLEHLRVISEHDDRYGDYTEFKLPEEEKP